jgi:hypothetical protein
MSDTGTESTRSAEASREREIWRGTWLWALVLALVLLYGLSAWMGGLFATLTLTGTAAVCWGYERHAAGRKHRAVTALLFAIGANVALAAANLALLLSPYGSAVRPIGLMMANVMFPVASGVIGTVLCVRGALADRGLWRLLSMVGLVLSLVVYHVGEFCFTAAVQLRGLALKP